MCPMYTMCLRKPEGNKLYSSGALYEDGVKYNYFTTSEDAVNAALLEWKLSGSLWCYRLGFPWEAGGLV